jgi:hypothetical protein
MGSTFQAQIDDYFVIPGTYTSAGGTTNFNFGYRAGRRGHRDGVTTDPITKINTLT